MLTNEQILDLEKELRNSDGPYDIENLGFGQGINLRNKYNNKITEINWFTAKHIQKHYDIASILLNEIKTLKGIK